jgi:hypothetical protein
MAKAVGDIIGNITYDVVATTSSTLKTLSYNTSHCSDIKIAVAPTMIATWTDKYQMSGSSQVFENGGMLDLLALQPI